MKLLLPRSLGAAAQVCERLDGSRFAMSCLKVVATEDGYRLEATDGKRLLVAHGGCPGDAYAIDLPGDFNAYLPPGQVLVDAQAFKEFCKPNGAKGTDKDAPVLLASDEAGQVFLGKPGHEARLPPCEGRYPNVDAVLPKGKALVRFRVRADLLISLLQAAQGVCGKKDLGVEFLWYGKDAPVGLTSQGEYGAVLCDMLIMPLA